MITISQEELNLNKDLSEQEQSRKNEIAFREALIEVSECLDSFYTHDTPRRLHPELKNFAGLIQVMDKATRDALNK